MIGASMAARAPRTRGLGQMAMDAIRRNGGTLLLPGASAPVLGEELVANGDFSNGTTGWTRGNTGTQTIESGALRVASDGTTAWSGVSETTIPKLTRGKQYLVQFSILDENTSGGAGLFFRTTSLSIGGLFTNGLDYFYPGAVGNYSILFTATVGDVTRLRLVAGSEANASVLFDNISVREILSYTHGNPPLRNYLDSAGTDLLDSVTQVDQPVGLALDSMGVLGGELFSTTLDFSNAAWIKTAAVTSSAVGAFATSAGGGVYTPVVGASTRTYSIRIVGTGTVPITFRNSGGVTGAHTVGIGSFDVTLNSTLFAESGSLYIFCSGAGTATITSISVREISGNHASQPTTANKGILRRTGNRYRWEFDGTDTLNMTLPAGFNAATTIDARSTGHVTLQNQNIVGAYSIGPSITSFGRIILPSSPSASDLALLQRYANWLAGVSV